MGLDVRIKGLQLHHIADSRLDAEIKAGEIVGITGANGAGKTEFLRMIAGILRPGTMGEIMIDGLDPFHERDLEKLHRRIGFAQQSPKDTMVFSRMIQDAPFGPENQAVDPEVIRKRWEGLKDRLIKDVPVEQDFDTLSGGQQQRAALVSVLMLRSQILLLDEPTSMLGKREGKEVLQLVLKLAKRSGQTVLLVSHDPELLKKTDRVLLLSEGRLKRIRKSELPTATAASGILAGSDAGMDVMAGRDAGMGVMSGRDAGMDVPAGRDAGMDVPAGRDIGMDHGKAGVWGDGSLRWIMKKQPDMATPLITLRDVSVRFGKKQVVEHFSAVVCPGGYYELEGGTGSGKSTLCKLMNGTLFANSGDVTVNGIHLPPAGQKRKTFFNRKGIQLGPVRRFAGYVMQSPEDQLFETSVIFDVMYGPLRAGRTAMEARQDAEAALRQLQVPEALWERRPERLSAGEQRRVAIAGILAVKPQVLILDEPYAGLDTEGCQVIRKLIESYVNQQKAVIVTTHR